MICLDLANANNSRKSGAHSGGRFGGDHGICFLMVLSPLRVPHDDRARPRVLKRLGADISGKRTINGRGTIFATDIDDPRTRLCRV